MAHLFTAFTGAFQSSEPMIHKMSQSLTQVTKTILKKIVDDQTLNKYGLTEEILNHTAPRYNLLNEDVKEELKKFDAQERSEFTLNAVRHIKEACRHIMKKSGLNNRIIKAANCLMPGERKKSRSINRVATLANELSFLKVPVTSLQNEWSLLAEEEDLKEQEGERIENYWQRVFDIMKSSGEPKYPNTIIIVKAVLAISHGSAEVERGFSASARYLTDEKASMCERTLNAAMLVKSGLKNCSPSTIPITKRLMDLVRNASHAYKEELRKENERKLDEERKKKAAVEEEVTAKIIKFKVACEMDAIKMDELKLDELRKNQASKRKIEEKLLQEACKKIKKATDLSDLAVVSALIEGANENIKIANKESKKLEAVEKNINEKKQILLSQFIEKKK